ncbi:MAG: helix-turn-helix domain-containing protein [Christensenellaceae bacterium]
MNRLKELRIRRNLRQDELAQAIGLNKQTCSLYECDKRKPSLAVYIRLARFYGVSLSYVMGFSDDTIYDPDREPTIVSEDEWKLVDLLERLDRAQLSLFEEELDLEVDKRELLRGSGRH